MKLEELLENYLYYTSMAGEFFVLAELSMRNYMASLTYGNAKSVDILVTKGKKMFKVEVKTTSREVVVGSDKSQFGANYEWQMSEKHEDKADRNLYYCFVILRKDTERPRFFIVRSAEVADYVKKEHEYWCTLERNKQVKTDSARRIFRIGINEKSHGLKPIKKYEDAWHILPK